MTTRRRDGREPSETRPVEIVTDFMPNAEGSVLIKNGGTHVICTATIQSSVPPWLRGRGTGWVTAEYGMLPRSTGERIDRRRAATSGRTKEIERLIGRSLRAVIDFDRMGEKSIVIDCDVLQADGGTRTAAITGGFVALALATQQHYGNVGSDSNPLRSTVSAISVGIVDGIPVLDLNYDEDYRAEVDMNVVMTGTGNFVEVQGTAEGSPFSNDQLNAMLELAREGCSQMTEAQTAAILRHRDD